jgi:hypothetical protein
MTRSDEFKYEVAFSFLKEDEGIVNLASGWTRQADEFGTVNENQGSGLNRRLQTREFPPLREAATHNLAVVHSGQ